MSARAAVRIGCCAAACFIAACSSSGDGEKGAGMGGSSGAAGHDESGGSGAGAGQTGSGGSSAAAGQTGSGGSSASGGQTGSGGAGAPDGSVPTMCTDDSTMYPCILHVDGKAIDAENKPITDHTLVSACGPAQCNPGYTDPAGSFMIPVALHINPDVYSAQVHVRVDKAAFYFALPKGTKGPVVDLGNLRVLDMPAKGPSLNVDRKGVPAQTVTSNDVTLDVPDGTYVRLDIESNLAGDHGKEFRALTIPSKFLPEFAAGSTGIKAMYALEPFECSFETPGAQAMQVKVRLSFANTLKLAAGSAVDVLALGSYIYPDWITPAAFEKVASAHVSADGSKIDFDKDEGVPYLTWVALRPAP